MIQIAPSQEAKPQFSLVAALVGLTVVALSSTASAEGRFLTEDFETLTVSQTCGSKAAEKISELRPKSAALYDGARPFRYTAAESSVELFGYGTGCLLTIRSSSAKTISLREVTSFATQLDRDPFLGETRASGQRFVQNCESLPKQKQESILDQLADTASAREVVANVGSYCKAINLVLSGLIQVDDGSEVALIRISGGLVAVWRR